ncbi:MAG: ATP-dependent DNA helicase RecG [Nitrospirae bacterium]|nr:ATP-dependent DNA helicase RecG [Candidatus Troglogloeales bacterium]
MISKKHFPWETPVQYLKKVGPKRAFLFGKLDIKTLEDLLTFLPFRYEDRREIKKIRDLTVGKEAYVVVYGAIQSIALIETSRWMKIVNIAVRDETGVVHAKWFNQPYLKDLFKKGDQIMLSGKLKTNYFGGAHLEMESPLYELADAGEPQLHMGRIVPIYHETKGFTSRQIRSIIKMVLDQYGQDIPEFLPAPLVKKYSMTSLSEAICECHFPSSDASLSLLNGGISLAHQRLAFDELFLLELGLALRKKTVATREKGIAFNTASKYVMQLRNLLPFSLTSAQEKVFTEIAEDMGSDYPMYRLLQGDVGSGKTLVAFMAILVALENGYQVALMAPTAILAEQHFLLLKKYCKAFNLSLLLFTSDMKKKEKEDALAKMESDEVHLVIGTHALIQGQVCFKNLGLVVVDEQHKFGVLQRARLFEKGVRPDMLIMTATPIPRTLALTVYGDLHLSVIDTLPPGRPPIKTRVFNGKQRPQVYAYLKQAFTAGRQAYVVCPLVEASEKVDLKAATELSATLQKEIFPDRKVGLLHGRQKREEKERIMREFQKGLIDLLVATTVIEVGIDLPNATVMVVEHAERFGLAQLHQLRGRVGRGTKQSYCFLIAEYPQSNDAKARLQVMQKSTDGFVIAEEDLAIRGPGEFFGTRQSGLPELKVANLMRDVVILETARKEAFLWIENDPALNQPESIPLRASLERKWKGKIEWLTTG